MSQNTYDTLIIGGGPIGLNCGIEAQKRGLSYLIVEKGCLANSIYHFPTNMTFFSTFDKIEIGNVPFVAHSDKPTRKEALEYYRRVKLHWQLNMHTYETVLRAEAQPNGLYHIHTDKATYQARSVIVATGFYDHPNRLHVPGEDLPKVRHYYDDPHLYEGQDIVVIGGGNSAADVALETYYKGARVTMVVRQPTLKPSIKYWIKPNIENRIKEGAIQAHFSSRVTAIYPDRIELDTPQGAMTLRNDFVLAMTGFRPNYALLQALGIDITSDDAQAPVHDPDTFETNQPRMYVAGVVCGGLITNKWFIENARYHADTITARIAEQLTEAATLA